MNFRSVVPLSVLRHLCSNKVLGVEASIMKDPETWSGGRGFIRHSGERVFVYADERRAYLYGGLGEMWFPHIAWHNMLNWAEQELLRRAVVQRLKAGTESPAVDPLVSA